MLELFGAMTDAGVQVYTLGGFRVLVDGREIDAREWQRRRAGAKLLKALVTREHRRMSKDEAYELLWPGTPPETASTSLRVTLSFIRKRLEPVDPVISERDHIGLVEASDVWVDADAFEGLMRQARAVSDPLEILQQADEVYAGEYLPDDVYEDWTAHRRQRLTSLWTELQLSLARLHEARHNADSAIACLKRVVDAEPEHELAVRELMRLLAQQGRRSEALREYDHLADIVQARFQVSPSSETRQLRDAIVGSVATVTGPPLEHAVARPAATTLGNQRQEANLPPSNTPMFGREQQVSEITAVLRDRTRRLVTLIGPGGVGKTRLALQVGNELVRGGIFADGVWWVPLAAVADARQVWSQIAQVIGLREAPGPSTQDHVLAHLRTRRLLLLLDNCEQIDGVARTIATLLDAGEGVALLVTSRIRLTIRGEHLYVVEPLPTPAANEHAALRTIGRFAALDLFLERARAAGCGIDDKDLEVIADICRRLDGLPLAIELAAPRLRSLTPDELRRVLPHVLRHGPSDLPERHQSLDNAISLSYRLLQPNEKVLFERASAFAGGCTWLAAESVCNPGGELGASVLDGFQALVDHSLIRHSVVNDESRYTMLETIRHFGREQLDKSDARDRTWSLFADWYVTLAEEAGKALASGRQEVTWLRRLQAEHPNFRAVLKWSLDSGNVAVGLRVAASIWRYWRRSDHASEGLTWLRQALPKASEVDPGLLASALDAGAELACALANVDEARAWCEESRQLMQRVKPSGAGRARTFHVLGWLLASHAESPGDYEHAEALQREAASLAQAEGNDVDYARALHELGEIARYKARVGLLDDFESALALHREAYALFVRLNDAESQAWSLHCQAWTHHDRGTFAEALLVSFEALGLWRQLDHTAGLAATRGVRARVLCAQHEYVDAAREVLESLALWPTLHHREWLDFDLVLVARLCMLARPHEGGAADAAELLGAARELRPKGDPPLHGRAEIQAVREQCDRYLDASAFESAFARGAILGDEAAARQAEAVAREIARAAVGRPR